jgi:hypothetical protein
MTNKILLSFSVLSILALTACAGGVTGDFDKNARYWQRSNTTDAIYQRGPKAQQMLFDDLATCTAEINELRRLGAIKNAIPPSTWDSTSRDGYLKSDHKDFTDFETCMTSKGWERVKFVDHETSTRARNDYMDAIEREQYRTGAGERVQRTHKLND